MKFFVGVTDIDWYRSLSAGKNDDINFWQPGGKTPFKVIDPGKPFLFKLKSPYNVIAGVGFFSSHSILPLDVAWNIFHERNGIDSYLKFRNKIINYRSADNSFLINPNIGCIVLTDPIFFKEEDWIPVPTDWNRSIVQGKSYDSVSGTGKLLWDCVDKVVEKYNMFEREEIVRSQLMVNDPDSEFTKKYLTKVRVGQGAFRVQLTDAYGRKCSITGEKTLPALDAAHIRPFADSGPYLLSNGILLRADLHKLYDSGYITFTNNYKGEVSTRIREEFENGREYYKFQGANLCVLPKRDFDKPGTEFIEWHNENVYRG